MDGDVKASKYRAEFHHAQFKGISVMSLIIGYFKVIKIWIPFFRIHVYIDF